ncbi:MAG TPA: hypothetical protein VLI93_01150 [Acetobacteraceae bacterium]|nr:hypothetical protein [Acetobacteraceae bacterium]
MTQDGDDEPDPVILRMVLADTATTLQKGITAGELQGTPVSARFNMSAGDIHLSVYTATATGFIETILDPKTGNLISAKPITDTEDLAYARIEKAAMEKATVSLLIATEKAIAENAGARAISAVPQLRKGQPIARVKLQRSTDSIAVSEPLN